MGRSRLESRPMPRAWRAGQRLGFDFRVRPVRRLLRDLETSRGRMARGADVDAFLAEALRRHPGEPGGMAGEGRTREAVYLDWLAERPGGAVELDRAGRRLAQFRRTGVLRGRSGLEGPEATIHGTLRVSDPDGFAELLRRGIGRHRTYGYGMLLLRPAGRPAPVRCRRDGRFRPGGRGFAVRCPALCWEGGRAFSRSGGDRHEYVLCRQAIPRDCGDRPFGKSRGARCRTGRGRQRAAGRRRG